MPWKRNANFCKSVIKKKNRTKSNHKIYYLPIPQAVKKGMVRERDRLKEEKKGWRGEDEESAKAPSQTWSYSPRRIGYRTWFYAAFVCAYACCLSSGRTFPALSHGRVGSRTSWGRILVDNSSQLCRGAPGPGLDLGWDRVVGILHSIFGRTVDAPLSDCHSCDCTRQVKTQRFASKKEILLKFGEENQQKLQLLETNLLVLP